MTNDQPLGDKIVAAMMDWLQRTIPAGLVPDGVQFSIHPDQTSHTGYGVSAIDVTGQHTPEELAALSRRITRIIEENLADD